MVAQTVPKLITHAGYQAVALLHKELAADDPLRQAVTEKWLPAIIDFPDRGEQLHKTLLALAVSLDRDCCMQKVYNDLLEQNTTQHMVYALEAFAFCWGDDVAEITAEFALRDATAETAANLLEFLSKVDQPSAVRLFEALARKGGKPSADNKFLVCVLSAAIEHLPTAIWPTAWQLLNGDRGFAEIVLLRVAVQRGFSSEGVAAELPPSQVAELYCLLRSLFPDNKDEDRSGTVTPRMAAGYFKNAQISILTATGTDEACKELLKLAELFPENRLWFKARYRECITSKRRKLWSPHDPSLVLRLMQRTANRIIEDADDLLAVVIESLDRLQRTLTETPNPQAGALWNYEGAGNNRRNFAPKDEEDLSGAIAAFLQNDISEIVLNREVQSQRGQRTDVLVDAVSTSNKEPRRVTVVIEVKGCWNPEVRTAIETQLARDYLETNGWTHGVYLVGWFMCPRWDHPMRKATSYLNSQTLKDARTEVNEIAAVYDGKTQLYVIRGYVLDCCVWTKTK